MKFVPFTKYERFESRSFLSEMLKSSPMGQTFGEMEQRLKVMGKLKEAHDDGVTLEDSEHATLKAVLDGRRDLGITDEEMFAIYKSVKEAITVPVPTTTKSEAP